MFKEGTCHKCKGRVYIDRDEYGWFVGCVMCGYMHDLTEIATAKQKQNSAEGKRESVSTEESKSSPTS